jgi:Transposase DDE domain
VPAILTMTGRITMSGISRWTEKGGSYRTVNRFFATVLPWNQLFITFFETHLFAPTHEYILAGDAARLGGKTGNLKKSSLEVLIVKDGERYLLTNKLELKSAEVRRIYRIRQQIEKVLRLLKQEFGWGKCRANSVQAQKSHLHLGLYAFCLVQSQAVEKEQTICVCKQDLFRQQIPTQ